MRSPEMRLPKPETASQNKTPETTRDRAREPAPDKRTAEKKHLFEQARVQDQELTIQAIEKLGNVMGVTFEKAEIVNLLKQIETNGADSLFTLTASAAEKRHGNLLEQIQNQPPTNESMEDEIGFDMAHIDTPANIESTNTPIPRSANELPQPNNEPEIVEEKTDTQSEATIPKFSARNINTNQETSPKSEEQIISKEKPKTLFDTINAHPPIQEDEEFTFIGTRAEQLQKERPPIEPTKPGFKFPPQQPPAAM